MNIVKTPTQHQVNLKPNVSVTYFGFHMKMALHVKMLPDESQKVTKSDHNIGVVSARLLYHAA